MFAIVGCPNCHNRRMVDLSSSSTACPFCGRKADMNSLDIKFKHYDQNIVRDVLQGNEDVPRVGDNDPIKKLRYEVAHCNDTGAKLEMIANGLCDLYGEFTEEDVEKIVPGKGEKYTSAMLEYCLIHEIGYGKFTV